MSFVYNTSKSKELTSKNSISVSETINFPNMKLFMGDAGKDPFFDLRMKASIIAMAQFLDFVDQTETYKYYPLGLKIKDALYSDYNRDKHKNLITQLSAYSYFFEKETRHPKTIFKDKDWVRASLNELDLWPAQFEVHYECFVSSQGSFLSEPLYRRIEVSRVIQAYCQKLEKFSFSHDEWSHLWGLIMEEYRN